jgi:hypothetical protein
VHTDCRNRYLVRRKKEMNVEGQVIKAADGRSYRVIPKGNGEYEYIEIRDVETHLQQTQETSHQDFFANHKQKVKRPEVLARQIAQAAQRVDPGPGAGRRQIKDEEFFRLNKMYKDAFDKGEQRECPFQPLHTYQHKITRARPIFAGEVGVYGAEILTLEAGFGTGQLIQVPSQLEGVTVLEAGAVPGIPQDEVPTFEEIQAYYDSIPASPVDAIRTATLEEVEVAIAAGKTDD